MASAMPQPPPDPEHIRAWQRLGQHRTTSGRLEAPDIAALAAIGVRHVINLAMPDHPESLVREAELLAQRGVGYTAIPVPFDAPDEGHFAQFVAALEAVEGPVHVHCIMNWRVSAFFHRYHRERLGMSDADARALMERHWSPESSTHPDAPAWADFIAR